MNPLVEKIRREVIGQRVSIATPFGLKPLIYADYTASGRSLAFIEDRIRTQVLPLYANTHTETNRTGAGTTAWRESARRMIKRAVNAGDNDKVIFCGSGATAAVNKLIDLLNLRSGDDHYGRENPAGQASDTERPVVLIGPYEHHSNELPWRESCALLEVIGLDTEGGIDLNALERALQRYQHHRLVIGSFSAASNVTGILSDVPAVTRLLKAYGALACWDYAAAGPYVRIDMNGPDALDAVFLSPHKFVGGPGTPGVLVAKSHLFRNRIPTMIGGGTVSYVTPETHVYVHDLERREEGGTPAIIESVRAGMVFSLQQQVGAEVIHELEQSMAVRAMQRLLTCPNLQVLGSHTAPRLPIFSLRFRHGNKDLHYGFVVALLNDLFGIQARGGCSCAGPYAHHLLEMDSSVSDQIGTAVAQGSAIMRPGWVRLSFNYFISPDEFDYLLTAITMVARHGWRLLPLYRYDTVTGVWRHQNYRATESDPLGVIDWLSTEIDQQPLCTDSLSDVLENSYRQMLMATPSGLVDPLTVVARHESLRWFVTPVEVNCN